MLTPELQQATPILKVAFGEMGVALAYFTYSLHANQRSDWHGSEKYLNVFPHHESYNRG